MVLLAHSAAEANFFLQLGLGDMLQPLTKGVDIFFVISGFIIYYTSQNLMGDYRNIRVFAYRRLTRIVPVYWFFTTLMVISLIVLPSGVKDTHFEFGNIISSYLFIPYEQYNGRIAPVLSLGWTLNYEMFFYLVFTVLIGLPRRWLVTVMTGLFIALGLFNLMLVGPEYPAVIRFWTNTIILEFLFGIAICELYLKHKTVFERWNILAVPVMVLGMVGLYVFNHVGIMEGIEIPRFITAGIPSAIIVGAGVLLLKDADQERIPNIFNLIGNSSYSLYLCHRFVLRGVQIPLAAFFPHTAILGVIYMAISIIGSIVAGVVFYLILEKPSIAFFRRKDVSQRFLGQS